MTFSSERPKQRKKVEVPLETDTLRVVREKVEYAAEIVREDLSLAVFTDYVLVAGGTTDPVSRAIALMTEQERRQFQWMISGGHPPKVDWSQKKTPEETKKKDKLRDREQAVRCLKFMYSMFPDIAQPPAPVEYGHVLAFYSQVDKAAPLLSAVIKIDSAQRGLSSGVEGADPEWMAEYISAKKIASEASSFVQRYMNMVRAETGRIDAATKVVQQRARIAKKKVGLVENDDHPENRAREATGQKRLGAAIDRSALPEGSRQKRQLGDVSDKLRVFVGAKAGPSTSNTTAPMNTD